MQAFTVSRPLLLGVGPPLTLTPLCPTRPAACIPVATRATLSPFASAAPNMSSPAQTEKAPLSSADEGRIAAVRAQMEFWFSTSNLRRDWYLRRQMDEDGWLDPAIFLLFNRIKNLHASLGDIILACRSSDLLEVSSPGAASFGDNAGQTRVRRSAQLPDFREKDIDEYSRSLIVTGLPGNATVDSLMGLFEPLAKVSYLRIYRHKDFPDSPRALLCFEDEDTADAIYKQFKNDKPEGAEGLSLIKRDPNRKEQQANSQFGASMETRADVWICRVSGLSPDLDWRVLSKHLQAYFGDADGREVIRYIMYTTADPECYITVSAGEPTKEVIADLTEKGLKIGDSDAQLRKLDDPEEIKEYWRLATEHQAVRKARRAEKQAQRSNTQDPDSVQRYPQGVIVRIDGLPTDASWRDIKSDLSQFGRLVYLNHERASATCHARFSSADEALKVVAQLSEESSAKICGGVVQAVVLEGQEEADYWLQAEQTQRERRSSKAVLDRREDGK